jgi:hypothetical protein
MQTHIKIVALLNIVLGAFVMLAGVAVAFGVGLLGLTTGDLGGILVLGTIGVLGGLLLVALALPQVVGGLGLLANRSWGRYVLIVTSAISLFKFPIGTVLGAYALWVLFHDDTKAAMR